MSLYSSRSTLSKELFFSQFFSGRLFPESVLIRDPRDSAWRTALMLGVDVWGDASEIRQEHERLIKWTESARVQTASCTKLPGYEGQGF